MLVHDEVRTIASSRTVNASEVAARVPFSTSSYHAAVGKAFALYYSSFSGEKVTSVEARAYHSLNATPASPDVFDPDSAMLLSRGSCPLQLLSQTNYPSAHHNASLRLAEMAVCMAMSDMPCKAGDVGCKVEVLAPLPYADHDEPYLAATIALVVKSFLCSEHSGAAEQDACMVHHRSDTAIAAGLQVVAGKVELKPIPGEWVELKLDACYELGFKKAVFAAGNQADFEETPYYSPDVLSFQHTPPEAVFCQDLACLESAMMVA